ncbi:MAG TPA: dolichyl-phosphate beta-glucosyltransferase [Candidatus Paceibacterota bacterium]|nr:dolichyl-phosphate beta-glucosyltransferase [Candidatus Paceibacterota bacterium]
MPLFLSIIIPCFNEEARIGSTLEAIGRFLGEQEYETEIIVVDNGSIDRSREIIRQFEGRVTNLRLLERHSHGKGYAVREGMVNASGKYRLFTDADNSTDIKQLPQLLSFARAGFDVVIGSRKITGSEIISPQPPLRIFLGNLFQWIVRLLIPLEIADTQDGFKLFSQRAAEKIFRHQTSFYWAFDVEILALAKRFGFRIKEVPIVWVNDERSGMNFKGMIRMFFEVLLIRIHLWTWDYRS